MSKISDIKKQTQIWYEEIKVKIFPQEHNTNFNLKITINCIHQTKSEPEIFIQDGCAYFEFEIEVDEPTGIPESLGVTEDMIFF